MTSDDVNAPSSDPAEPPTDVASRDSPRPSAALTELEALDQETPTQALKSLGILCVIASVILMIPRQYASAAIAFGLGIILLLWRHLRQRREQKRG